MAANYYKLLPNVALALIRISLYYFSSELLYPIDMLLRTGVP